MTWNQRRGHSESAGKAGKGAIERYRQAQEERSSEQRAEEMAEMRAAFGTGSTIVDILTGERFEI